MNKFSLTGVLGSSDPFFSENAPPDNQTIENEIMERLKIRELLESQASEEAKKKGLKHVGYGNWADKKGNIIAKTSDGKLVFVKNKKTKTSLSKKDSISGNPEAEKKISDKLESIYKKVTKLKEQGKKIPDFDLCKVTIPGTNLFCKQSKDIPRHEMPQLKGFPEKDSKAEKLDKDKNGEISAEDLFKKQLKKDGHKIEKKNVDVTKLKATQNQLVGAKIAGMLHALKTKPPKETKGIREPIFVSKDGYILDGHHRWAALVGLDLADGKGPSVKMDIMQVDMKIEDLIKYTNEFTNKIGIKQKKGKVKESFQLFEQKFKHNFSINKYALAIFQKLKKNDYENVHTLLANPLYNGREKGIALKITKDLSSDATLFVNFGQDRSGEKLFVSIGLTAGHHLEPASLNDISDDIHKKRKYFEFSELENATEYIDKHIKKFLNTVDYGYLPRSKNYSSINESTKQKVYSIIENLNLTIK